MYPTPIPITMAELSDAHDLICRLLAQGTADDLRDGPRWRKLSAAEVRAHRVAHDATTDRDCLRIDPDSGLLEMAHAVVRRLQELQLAIEEVRLRDSGKQSAQER